MHKASASQRNMIKFNKNLMLAVAGLLGLAVIILVMNMKGVRNVSMNSLSASVYETFVQSNNFAILGGSTITNTGNSVITGDLGLSPGTAITGFFGTTENDGPGTISGAVHQTNQTAADAQVALTGAYNATASQACTQNLTGQNLGGLTLTPGVYCFDAEAQLTGTLTLNAQGNANAIFIFKIGTTLTTASGSSVIFTNSVGSSCNVFWQVGTSATLGGTSSFKGNIFALTAISTGNAGTVNGRLLARNAAVTLINTSVNAPICVAPVIPVDPGTLHIIKNVINDNGGTAVASDFTINVSGTNVSSSSFAGSETGINITLDAGAYAITESAIPTGYLESGSGDCSGTILAGETKTCTITNNDIAPQLIVTKTIINLDGGTKLSFPLFIDGVSVTSGDVNTTTIGLHTVSETSDAGYTASLWGGDCAADGTITLSLGDIKTCTITNDDIAVVASPSRRGNSGMRSIVIPPLIAVLKVPSPLALPLGPGPVTYTYTLRNIGTVPVYNVTMVGDTCSPIVRISGDTNADAKLDVTETWVHTCTTTLQKTHTNIITATGWANGISATDIANATVIVGVPKVPPLIHVTKIPNPLFLSAAGGPVTYTNKVTNPGTVPLSNIQISDDKCSPVKYISGDVNGDSKLDVTEIWTYTCKRNLTQTTTNTVIASGDANGLTARDFAIATVVVSVPGLPKTGFAPIAK